MNSSKLIERLFQESFKDFQASPSPKVWDGIEDKLAGEKQSRRVLPFWWQVASVAAIILIFSSIGVFYYNTSESKTTLLSNENLKYKSPSNSVEIIPARYSFSSVNKNLSTIENSIENSLAFQIIDLESENNSTNFEQIIQLKDSQESSAVEKRVTKRSFSTVNQLNRSPLYSFSNSLTAFKLLETDNGKTKEKKSLFDAIEEEKLLALENDDSVDKPWAIQPNVAPVFMNSFGGGNPIESSLQGKTSSNPNVSYGVNMSYAINKKIKIRTGINQVAMGYNTQDVILSVSSTSFRTDGSENLNVQSNLIGDVSLVSAIKNRNIQSRESINSFGSLASKFNSVGAINHELGFVEVPLEVEYALIDKKIGLHILGGASTYVLNNNEVYFEENGRSSSIGKADNLNSFSFSANLGVGMDYNFSERVSFNLEPKFLYQINTFHSHTSTFQPYFFGIYSGIKFKF